MLPALIGPIGNLASSWLQGKADAASAAANLKLVEAEAKATIMKSAATSEAEWERLMAEGTKIRGRTNIWFCFSVFLSSFVLQGIGGAPQLLKALRLWSKCPSGINIRWV